MIELKNVSKFYNDNNIVTVGLRNVSITLNKGEFVAITGDSGSGKSTLLNVISSVDVYDEGEILYYGNEPFYFNQNDSDIFRKNNVSFIFQKYNIVDSYTVLENVMLPLIIKGKTEIEAKEEALEIIKRVGLSNRVSNKGTKLSGGEKQRCVIARALASDAPILACDEPTGNLDKNTSNEIIKLIKEVASDKLVLFVTHDFESIKDVCTRKIKLSDGEIIEDIVFNEGITEEAKELVLADSKPSKKILVNLAKKNIFSTPKKAIFTMLVFSFVACVFLLLSLYFIKVSYESNYTYNENYGIISTDRLIIYDEDHNSLDMEKLETLLDGYECYNNAFYEEINGHIRMGQMVAYNTGFTFHDIDFELISGSSNIAKDEFIFVAPKSYYIGEYTSCIGEDIELTVEADYDYNIKIGKLVGVGFSDEVNHPYLVGNKNNTTVSNLLLFNEVEFKMSSTLSTRTIVSKFYVSNATTSYYLIPSQLKDDIEFNFNIKGIYNVSYDLETIYSDEVTKPTVVLNTDFLNGFVPVSFDGVKEITVYTNNAKKLAKQVNNLGYDVSIPSMIENNDGISMIVLYMLSIVIFISLVIMFFISFSIIQRIYLTKTKDYSIFRTLGLVSKDLRKVLNIEVLMVTGLSIIFGAGFTFIIILATKIDLYKYVGVVLVLIYIFVMLVFGLLTSNRLNKKIFNHSVYHALKEGGE